MIPASMKGLVGAVENALDTTIEVEEESMSW